MVFKTRVRSMFISIEICCSYQLYLLACSLADVSSDLGANVLWAQVAAAKVVILVVLSGTILANSSALVSV